MIAKQAVSLSPLPPLRHSTQPHSHTATLPAVAERRQQERAGAQREQRERETTLRLRGLSGVRLRSLSPLSSLPLSSPLPLSAPPLLSAVCSLWLSSLCTSLWDMSLGFIDDPCNRRCVDLAGR